MQFPNTEYSWNTTFCAGQKKFLSTKFLHEFSLNPLCPPQTMGSEMNEANPRYAWRGGWGLCIASRRSPVRARAARPRGKVWPHKPSECSGP